MVEAIEVMVLGGVAVALLFVIKYSLDLRNHVSSRTRELNEKLLNLEHRAIALRKEVSEMHKSMSEKAEHSELERRIGGLIDLLKKERIARH